MDGYDLGDERAGYAIVTREAESAGRRTQMWLFSAALIVLVATVAVGAGYAKAVAERDARRRIERAAEVASRALEAEFDSIVDSLDGADVIGGPDGAPDQDLFEVFGGDVLARRDLPAIWLVDAASVGGYQVSARAATDGATRVGGDVPPSLRVALDRATETGVPVAARIQSGARAATVAVARPIPVDSGAVRAFVVAFVPDSQIESTLADSLGPDVRAVATMNDVSVLGEPFERRARTSSASARVVDRTWTLIVGPRGPADLTVMWAVIAAGTLALAALSGMIVVTARRQARLLDANALLELERDLDRALHVVIGHLARSLTGDDVVATLRHLLPDAVGAKTATLGLIRADGTLRIFDGEAASGTDIDHGRTLDSVGPLLETTIASGNAAFLSSPIEWRDDPTAAVLAHGGNALALLPLGSQDVRGALAVSYDRFRVFDPREQQVLQTVAALAAQALERGRRYDEEHEAAVTFQRAALPDALPTVPGLSITARYRPAARHAAVGGDWYDVVPLDAHRTLLVVGDVVGHGMEAAAAMGRLRTALRVIATLDPDPGAILHTLGHQVDAIPNAFCTTVLCAVFDRRDGVLSWSRAGHMPPLLLSAHGTELLDQRCTPPLGVVLEAEVPVHTRRLRVGDRLLLFTDGIVERRDEGIDVGLDRLAIMAETLADLGHAEFIDALIEAIVPHDDQVDDIAILVLALDAASDATDP